MSWGKIGYCQRGGGVGGVQGEGSGSVSIERSRLDFTVKGKG